MEEENRFTVILAVVVQKYLNTEFSGKLQEKAEVLGKIAMLQKHGLDIVQIFPKSIKYFRTIKNNSGKVQIYELRVTCNRNSYRLFFSITRENLIKIININYIFQKKNQKIIKKHITSILNSFKSILIIIR